MSRSRFHMRLQHTRSLFALMLLGAAAVTVNAQGGAPLTTVRVSAVAAAVMPVDFRAGIKEGIFRKHGLDVQVNTLATGTENITAAVQGSTDVAYADVFAGLSAISNGFDIGLLSPHNTTSPTNYILVREDSPIKSLSDLRGKNIAIGAPPQFKTITSAVLDAAGVDPKQVKFTIIRDQTTFGAALKAQQIDAVSTSSTINTYRWVHDYKFRALTSDSRQLGIAKDSPIAGWWVTRSWYERHPKEARAFHAASQETIQWFSGLNAQQRAAYVKEQARVDLVQLDQETPGVLAAATDYFGFFGPVRTEPLGRFIDLGKRYADVPVPADVNKHIFPLARGEATP